MTCTTVGYGDLTPSTGPTRGFFGAFLLVLCIVVTKTGSDLYHISIKRRIRIGESQPDIEAMLLRKAMRSPQSKSGYSVSESEYIVEALLREKLVDRYVLLAVRRTYHWVARGGDGCRCDISAVDLYEHHRSKARNTADRSSTRAFGASLARCAAKFVKKWLPRVSQGYEDEATTDDEASHAVDETYEEWLQRYWEPKVAEAQSAGQRARAYERMRTDPFAIERAWSETIDRSSSDSNDRSLEDCSKLVLPMNAEKFDASILAHSKKTARRKRSVVSGNTAVDTQTISRKADAPQIRADFTCLSPDSVDEPRAVQPSEPVDEPAPRGLLRGLLKELSEGSLYSLVRDALEGPNGTKVTPLDTNLSHAPQRRGVDSAHDAPQSENSGCANDRCCLQDAMHR